MAAEDTPAPKTPESSVTIARQPNGTWAFSLTYRGVSYPAQGGYPSRVLAEYHGKNALMLLEQPKS